MRKDRKIHIFPGDRFGPSVVIRELPRSKWERMFHVQCDCGEEHVLGFKTLRARKHCISGRKKINQSCVAIQVKEKYPFYRHDVKKSKIYELWVSVRREKDASVCKDWDNFLSFLADVSELTGTHELQLLQPRIEWCHWTFERIDKDDIWIKPNVTARVFYSERAYHRETYDYWKLLGSKGLLEEDLKESYTLFLNTFGEKIPGYVLRRINRRKLHSSTNSEWVLRSFKIAERHVDIKQFNIGR